MTLIVRFPCSFFFHSVEQNARNQPKISKQYFFHSSSSIHLWCGVVKKRKKIQRMPFALPDWRMYWWRTDWADDFRLHALCASLSDNSFLVFGFIHLAGYLSLPPILYHSLKFSIILKTVFNKGTTIFNSVKQFYVCLWCGEPFWILRCSFSLRKRSNCVFCCSLRYSPITLRLCYLFLVSNFPFTILPTVITLMFTSFMLKRKN